jgi:P-type E1-E2 ATPase
MMMKCEASKIGVFRGGTEPTMLSNDDLVVGDVFMFQNGMKIPADGVMIAGKDVKCEEGALTGEPDQFEKVALDAEKAQIDELSGVLLAKTVCCSGEGKAVVTCVGISTAAGAIAGG